MLGVKSKGIVISEIKIKTSKKNNTKNRISGKFFLKRWQHATSHNRTVYASPPVGGSAPGCACSTTLFCFVPRPCGLLLSTEWTWITAQNKGAHGVRPGWAHPTSYTAGTLCASLPRLFVQYWQYNKNMNIIQPKR